jgi:hypothetical protein
MVDERPVAMEGSSDVAQSCAPKESTRESEDDAVGRIGLESNLIVLKPAMGQERKSLQAEAGGAPYCMLMVRVCAVVWCGVRKTRYVKSVRYKLFVCITLPALLCRTINTSRH